jgi:hypothetical protein
MSAESKTRSVWKLFFVWQAEKEERWLEQMARHGWHLVRGGIRFTFRQGPPAEVRYRLDYRRGLHGGLEEFKTLCRDAGWEYVDRFLDWHYFRATSAAAPELYTDTESLIDRDRRILGLLLLVLMVMVLQISTGVGPRRGSLSTLYESLRFVQFVMAAVLGYAVFRVFRHMKALKTRPPA